MHVPLPRGTAPSCCPFRPSSASSPRPAPADSGLRCSGCLAGLSLPTSQRNVTSSTGLLERSSVCQASCRGPGPGRACAYSVACRTAKRHLCAGPLVTVILLSSSYVPGRWWGSTSQALLLTATGVARPRRRARTYGHTMENAAYFCISGPPHRRQQRIKGLAQLLVRHARRWGQAASRHGPGPEPLRLGPGPLVMTYWVLYTDGPTGTPPSGDGRRIGSTQNKVFKRRRFLLLFASLTGGSPLASQKRYDWAQIMPTSLSVLYAGAVPDLRRLDRSPSALYRQHSPAMAEAGQRFGRTSRAWCPTGDCRRHIRASEPLASWETRYARRAPGGTSAARTVTMKTMMGRSVYTLTSRILHPLYKEENPAINRSYAA